MLKCTDSGPLVPGARVRRPSSKLSSASFRKFTEFIKFTQFALPTLRGQPDPITEGSVLSNATL